MNNVTLCITMGRRPELLRQTLSSLFSVCEFQHVIAINDFRDDQTNEAFKALCPTGQLISLDHQLGHHAAVDHMYSKVQTDWVFHTEDDWEFTEPVDLDRLVNLVKQHAWMAGVSLRSEVDFGLCEADQKKVLHEHYNDLDVFRLDGMHDQWHGFTFNPHLAPLNTWRKVGPFSRFKKERHISRAVRQAGMVMPYLTHGGCRHIGWENSVSHPSKRASFWSRWLG
jgi:glycosyltransferase involved in cell wall biosynthesis